jgi:hypothetical protein
MPTQACCGDEHCLNVRYAVELADYLLLCGVSVPVGQATNTARWHRCGVRTVWGLRQASEPISNRPVCFMTHSHLRLGSRCAAACPCGFPTCS